MVDSTQRMGASDLVRTILAENFLVCDGSAFIFIGNAGLICRVRIAPQRMAMVELCPGCPLRQLGGCALGVSDPKSSLVTKVTVLSNNCLACVFSSAYDDRVPKRREKRLTVPIAVRLWGLDRDGKVFSQNARTLDIATNGARLYGVTAS